MTYRRFALAEANQVLNPEPPQRPVGQATPPLALQYAFYGAQRAPTDPDHLLITAKEASSYATGCYTMKNTTATD